MQENNDITQQPISRRAVALGAGALLASGAIALRPQGLAFADKLGDKRAEAQMALNKIKKLESQADEASARYNMALMEKEHAEEIMNAVQERVKAANEEIASIQDKLSIRLEEMYKSGSGSILDVLFGSETFESFATNWSILTHLSEEDAQEIEQIKALRRKTVVEYDTYEQQKNEADRLAEEAKQVKKEAKKLLKEAKDSYDKLSEEAAALLAEEEAKADAAMQAEILRRLAAGEDVDPSDLNANDLKPQSVDGRTVVQRARREIGKPYVWGACGPHSFDCSGLVSYCLCGEYGRRLGTTYTFMNWTRVTKPKLGDICVNSHHCGIYIGNGQMIHAPNSRSSVKAGAVHSDMIFVRY